MVYRNAGWLRIAVIPQTGRNGTFVNHKFPAQIVKLSGCHPDLNIRSDIVETFGRHFACLAHSLIIGSIINHNSVSSFNSQRFSPNIKFSSFELSLYSYRWLCKHIRKISTRFLPRQKSWPPPSAQYSTQIWYRHSLPAAQSAPPWFRVPFPAAWQTRWTFPFQKN